MVAITEQMEEAFHSKVTVTRQGSILNFKEGFAAALAAQGQEPVVVKELEWVEPMCGPDEYVTIGKADALNFHYRIESYLGKIEVKRSCDIQPCAWGADIEAAKAAAQSDYETRIRSALAAPAQPVGVPEGWRDDPASDDRWNAGLEYAHLQLCKVLGVDPQAVAWDAATETLDGDVSAVTCNILNAAFGDDWRDNLASENASLRQQLAEAR